MIKYRINEPSLSDLEKKYVNEVLDENWLSAGGSLTEEFESLVTDYLGVKYGIAVQSGTSALHLALKVAGVSENDHVIIPNYSCVSRISATAQCLARPIIVEIENNTLVLDFSLLKKAREKY